MDLFTGPAIQPYRNYGLFSDRSLDHTLLVHPVWREFADEAQPAMEKRACVFESYAPS